MKKASEMVEEARAKIENLDVDSVEREISGGDVLLIDIREAEEREGGSIQSAIHMPRGMLEFYADPTSPHHREPLDPSKRVILHCAGGLRSALAAATLKDMGYEQVAHLDGGFKAWKEAGKPIV